MGQPDSALVDIWGLKRKDRAAALAAVDAELVEIEDAASEERRTWAVQLLRYLAAMASGGKCG